MKKKINLKKLAKVLRKGVLLKAIPGVVIAKDLLDAVKEQEQRLGNQGTSESKVPSDS